VSGERLAPLTGVVFVILAIVGFAVGGEPPDADSPVREIVDHYVDNKDSVTAGAFVVGVGLLFLIFFAGYLRKVLRAAEGPDGMLSAVALVGASILAVGAAIDLTITIALAEGADDIAPTATQALQALWDNDFMPIALGGGVFLLASGISIARHGALPKWLGWLAILLGVLSVTPLGFIGFLGGGIWILIASVILTLRAPAAAAQQG
jgi:hypothetical protein